MESLNARAHAYGSRGPEAERGGYDATAFWTRGGVATTLTPASGAEPPFQRAAFGDGIGGMTLAGGIAAALFHRQRTGEAQVVDVSLLGTAMWVMSPDIVASKLLGVPQLPIGPRPWRPNPVVNNYRTRDGRWLILVHLQADRYWPDLCRRIGRPDLATDPRFANMPARAKNAAACTAELDTVFATRTLEEWRWAFDDMEGPWGGHANAARAARGPQAVANGYLREVCAAASP
jgi:crotonobetainyl-CoA:carnitine CoA-transferase CaiB-like acyl-CoA transferase